MEIINLEKLNYKNLVEQIQKGGLGIFPFDTCYGLICDPCNQKAVDKLLSYKARREGKAISIAVSSIDMAEKYADLDIPAKNFFRHFLPGPYTIITNSRHKFASGIEAENGTIGIRIPEYKPLLTLIDMLDSPLTATSANQSYQKIPYKIQDIFEISSSKALNLIDFIIDAGELSKNPPSTIVDMSNENIHILRKGSIIPANAKTQEFISSSEEETIAFARSLMEKYYANLNFRPIIFALQGDMGAGKTHFTKGLAEALGVKARIQSPTFIISSEYSLEKRNKLYHIDTWRLNLKDDFQELEDLEFIKMLEKKESLDLFNIISIEWADKIQEYIQKLDLNIKILWVEILKDPEIQNKRVIRFSE